MYINKIPYEWQIMKCKQKAPINFTLAISMAFFKIVVYNI